MLADEPPEERLQAGDNSVQVERLHLSNLTAAECEELLGQCRRPLGSPDYLVEVLPLLATLFQTLRGHDGQAANDGQQVIEVVRDPTSQPADGLHPLRLLKLVLESALISDVALDSGSTDQLTRRVIQRGQGERHQNSLTVLADPGGLIVRDMLAGSNASKQGVLFVVEIGGDQTEDGRTDHLRRGITEDALG